MCTLSVAYSLSYIVLLGGAMMRNRRVELDGQEYIWIDSEWFDARTYISPPQVIVRQLNALIERELASEDALISNAAVLIARASAARDAEQYHRAETLVRRALFLAPDNCAAAAVLCSILRATSRPQQALRETAKFKSDHHPALLTSRAAAFCDLHKWEEAKREVGQALAIATSEEAFQVVHRIKAARPDLYERRG